MAARRTRSATKPPEAGGADPFGPDFRPMEADSVDALPSGGAWQYEPKYDGFRCIAVLGADVRLLSRNGKPLARYFPEVVAALGAAGADAVLDGELVIPGAPFETLQLRLHPAASRIATLSAAHPAELVAFDLLAEMGRPLLAEPLAARRAALEAFAARHTGAFRLGVATRSLATARKWLGGEGLDGIVAKRLDDPYQPGRRAMQKYKEWRTVDCVVGGLYRSRGTNVAESLLLGLYDAQGRLNYVGHARLGADAAEIGALLEPLVGGEGFTGRAPGGRSRWSGETRAPVPLRPTLVVEVSADHITSGTMRHGARLLRFRTDKPPEACTLDQIA